MKLHFLTGPSQYALPFSHYNPFQNIRSINTIIPHDDEIAYHGFIKAVIHSGRDQPQGLSPLDHNTLHLVQESPDPHKT